MVPFPPAQCGANLLPLKQMAVQWWTVAPTLHHASLKSLWAKKTTMTQTVLMLQQCKEVRERGSKTTMKEKGNRTPVMYPVISRIAMFIFFCLFFYCFRIFIILIFSCCRREACRQLVYCRVFTASQAQVRQAMWLLIHWHHWTDNM